MIPFACRRLLFLAVTSCALGATSALAREPLEGSLDGLRDTDLFAGYVPTFQSGDALPKEGVFAITLQPAADVAYFARPNGEPRLGYGGIVTLESVAAGRYGIVLSQEARLEAVQHQPLLLIRVAQWKMESDHSRIAEIVVESGPLTLQVSGVTTPSIMIAMTRLPDRALVAPRREARE
jgi:hypothetical protein